MDVVSLALAKRYTNEQLNKLPNDRPVKKLVFDGGILSLPSDVVEGQISEIRILGTSLKNELNYNRETWAEWSKILSAGDVTGLEFTGDGAEYPRAHMNSSLKPSTKYGILFNVIVNNMDKSLMLSNYLTGSNVLLANANFVGNTKTIITTTTPINTNRFRFEISCPAAGTKLKIRDIRVFELPPGSQIEADFTNLTADQLAQKYPYIKGDGVKSTVSARVKSVGKNLIDKSKIKTGKYWNSDNTLSADTTSIYSEEYIPVVVNANYKITSPQGSIQVMEFDIYKKFIQRINTTSVGIYTPGANVKYIRVSFYTAGTSAIDTVQIEKGTVATSYEPHKLSQAYISGAGELRSVGIVKDEVRLTEGQEIQRVSDEVIINGNLNWQGYTFDATNDLGKMYAVNFAANNNAKLGASLANGGVINITNSQSINGISVGSTSGELWINIKSPSVLGIIDLTTFKSWLNSNPQTLIYQLASPIVTPLPTQPPLKVFENGTVFVEIIGDPAESTHPTVELSVPIGTYAKYGIATKDYQAAVADWVLSAQECKCMLLIATNAGGAANIIAPDKPGLLYAVNNKSGQIITIKKSGGTGVAIGAGKTVLVMHSGTDYIKITGEV